MIKFQRFLLLACLVTASVYSERIVAGEFNPQVSLGDPAPTFENLPAVDGKHYSSSDFAGTPVMVIAFTCNSCPYAIDYENRLIELTKKYQAGGKVAVVAINCNLVPADSLEKMQSRAKEKAFPFIYLFDESQQTAKQFGALRTPEFFVLDSDRKIVYMGAFDDNTDASKAQVPYVDNAIAATLSGETIETAETPPIGCLIRFKRQRGR